MPNVKISALPYVGSSGYTSGDTFVLVNYILPSGTTSNTKITDLKDYFTSGLTFDYLSLSGGTVTGDTIFSSGLTASTFSATTYLGLPQITSVTDFTYSSNTFTITVNSATTFNATINDVTGLTVNGDLTVTGNTNVDGITANTVSATTYLGLPQDIYVSGFSYSDNTFSISDNSGNTFSTTINDVTGLTVNGDLTITGVTSVDIITGNTLGESGNCFNDLFISNVHSCSPLNINPLDEGNVYFGSTNILTVDLSNNRIGIGTSSPNYIFHVVGDSFVNGSVIITGNVDILGTATTINTQTLTVEDNLITLNSNYTGSTAPFFGDSGFEILRGSATTASLIWNEQNTRFEAGLTGSTRQILLSGDSLSLLNTGHTHPISEVINLQSELNNKFDITGGTINGTISATTISGGTFYGDGSNLDGVTDYYVTGTSFNGGTFFIYDNSGTTFSTQITGFTGTTVVQTVSATTVYVGGTTVAPAINLFNYYNFT